MTCRPPFPAGEFANVDSPFKAATVSPVTSVEGLLPLVTRRALAPPRTSLDNHGRSTSAPPASLIHSALPPLKPLDPCADFELTPEQLDAPSTRPIPPVGKKQPAVPDKQPAPESDGEGLFLAWRRCVAALTSQLQSYACSSSRATSSCA